MGPVGFQRLTSQPRAARVRCGSSPAPRRRLGSRSKAAKPKPPHCGDSARARASAAPGVVGCATTLHLWLLYARSCGGLDVAPLLKLSNLLLVVGCKLFHRPAHSHMLVVASSTRDLTHASIQYVYAQVGCWCACCVLHLHLPYDYTSTTRTTRAQHANLHVEG